MSKELEKLAALSTTHQSKVECANGENNAENHALREQILKLNQEIVELNHALSEAAKPETMESSREEALSEIRGMLEKQLVEAKAKTRIEVEKMEAKRREVSIHVHVRGAS